MKTLSQCPSCSSGLAQRVTCEKLVPESPGFVPRQFIIWEVTTTFVCGAMFRRSWTSETDIGVNCLYPCGEDKKRVEKRYQRQLDSLGD